MLIRTHSLCLVILIFFIISLIAASENNPEKNTILIEISIKNRETLLPYFLTFFHRLSFPKKQICLVIILQRSIDKTADIVDTWLKNYGEEYRNVNLQKEDKELDSKEMREKILNTARDIRVDYVLFIDPIAFLVEKNIVQHLMSKNKIVVAGMLKSSETFSNFWGEITEDYDYKRAYFYMDIYTREHQGCFKVALVQSCILIDLRKKESSHLSFLGPDIYPVALTLSARSQNIPLIICNDLLFGFIISNSKNSDNYNMEEEINRMKEMKNLIHKAMIPLHPLEQFFSSGFVKYPEIDNLGMNQIYVINLLKRPMKKIIMEERLKEIGLKVQFFEGIDGAEANSTYLMSIGANQLKTYDDIYMTVGQIGAFLSHYSIWKDAIKNKYERIMVLEDDTEFELDFRAIVKGALQEVDKTGLEWELLFVNRGHAKGPLGDKVNHYKYLKEVGYGMLSCSGYILNLKGAHKLATSSVITELIPIDEYILMMHSYEYRNFREWENNYGPPDMKVYLIDPQPSYNVPFRNHSKSIRETDTFFASRTNDETFGVPIGQKVFTAKVEL